MMVNKPGQYHIDYDLPNQDGGFEIENQYKVVTDGCSGSKRSDIGVYLFNKILKEWMDEVHPELASSHIESIIERTFHELIDSFFHIGADIINHLLFTILIVIEKTESFEIYYCGDGYIIEQDMNDNIKFFALENQIENTPEYYGYNFVNYKNIIKLKKLIYSKKNFKNVGVASDGLKYLIESEYVNEFKNYLNNKKDVKISMLLNRIRKVLKDDITIAF